MALFSHCLETAVVQFGFPKPCASCVAGLFQQHREMEEDMNYSV